MFKTSRAAQALSICSMMLLTTAAALADTTPVITNATVDTAANTLTLTGSNLLGPTGAGVFFVQINSPFMQLALTSSSTTSIVAGFPAGSPASSLGNGTYTGQVRFFGAATSTTSNVATFTLTIPSAGTPPPQNPPTDPLPPTSATTTLLFQYLNTLFSNTSSIVILNTSGLSATASGSSGVCHITLVGQNGSATFDTTTIPVGGMYTNFINNTAQNFGGYATAVCAFKAQGLTIGGVSGVTAPGYVVPAVVNP
jgi:hypothetical protein